MIYIAAKNVGIQNVTRPFDVFVILLKISDAMDVESTKWWHSYSSQNTITLWMFFFHNSIVRCLQTWYSRWNINMKRYEKNICFSSGLHTIIRYTISWAPTVCTVYPKKYAHGFCFAVLCCGYTLTDFPITIRLTSLALWQSNDCPSASKATLMNMDKYFMWIHYERLHNHNKAKHNKTVCIFLGIYCKLIQNDVNCGQCGPV